MSSPNNAPNLNDFIEKLNSLNANLFGSKNILRLLESGLKDALATADNPGVMYDPEDYEDTIHGLEQQIAEIKRPISHDERERDELLLFLNENLPE